MSRVFHLKDYKILDLIIRNIELEINLSLNPIQTTAKLIITKNSQSFKLASKLRLDCENLQVCSIFLNERQLLAEEFVQTKEELLITNIPTEFPFSLTITSNLGLNTDLFGLYETEGIILVKAETEGLRRVFPCLDRPDNLATYKTTIIADSEKYPVLISNGVLIESHNLSSNLHSCTWHDSTPKPSYLFALVAGHLTCRSYTFIKKSGNPLELKFYMPEKALAQCEFAQKVLEAAIQWDEQRFNLECPLTEYKIAGVDKYASGASEPLGLNLFNTTNLLASHESRIDKDIIRVIDVVAHEYFHTWTGDLVTIRDWFNLTLKEGLATLRANLFIEDTLGFDFERLFSKRSLDHLAPRPDSYTVVRSLYTTAAYEKSAEIFRMILKVIGKEVFDNLLSQFLHLYQGQAITLEQLLDYFSAQQPHDCQTFINWFTQEGIPEVFVTESYSTELCQYQLQFKVKHFDNRPIPIALKIFDTNGTALVTETTCLLDKQEHIIKFENIISAPVVSLLRDFSAPVILQHKPKSSDLLILLQHDDDPYNKCMAAKRIYWLLIESFCNNETSTLQSNFISLLKKLIYSSIHPWILAEILTLPSLEQLNLELSNYDLELIASSQRKLKYHIAFNLKAEILQLLNSIKAQKNKVEEGLFDLSKAGFRRLRIICYSYLLVIEPENTKTKLNKIFHSALGTNMTEALGSLNLLMNSNYKQSNKLLAIFYNYWSEDSIAINYWFSLQASIHEPGVNKIVKQLMAHPAFDYSNPNKVFALLGPFIKNPYGFNALSGEGFQLLAEAIIRIDTTNPTLAMNLLNAFKKPSRISEITLKFLLNKLKKISTQIKSAPLKDKILEIETFLKSNFNSLDTA